MRSRKNIRLPNYDYTSEGFYFITICTFNKECLFGNIVNGEMILNEYGKIAHHELEKLPLRFPNIVMDVFQIMPNHVHTIISITTVGAGLAPALSWVAPALSGVDAMAGVDVLAGVDDRAGVDAMAGVDFDDRAGVDFDDRAGASPAPTNKTIGNMVGAYKSLVSTKCLELFKQRCPGNLLGKIWQRNYYEHIIRSEKSYTDIAYYIINNPQKWDNDCLKP